MATGDIRYIITVDAARRALPSSVPKRLVDLNVKAFERGWSYGMQVLGELPKSGGATGAKSGIRRAKGK